MFFLFIFGSFFSIPLFSQSYNNYNTSITIIVTRADNGRPIPGAQIYLFGAYEGNYSTNARGIIKLNKFSKEQLLNSFKQSIVNLNDYKKFLKNKDIAFKIEFKGNWQKIVEAIKIWKSQQG